MIGSPFVTIIIPTFNSQPTIEDCLTSIANQNFHNYEILIIDGQSKDNTKELIKPFLNNKVQFLSEPDLGIYDAMNKGIRKAKGQWLYFLGSDDALHDEHVLRDMCEHHLKGDSLMVYGKALVLPKKTITPIDFDFNKLTQFNICHQAIFYARKVFEDRQYDLTYPTLADWDLNLQLMAKFPQQIKAVDRVICRFMNLGVSSDWKRSSEYRDNFASPVTLYGRYLPRRKIFGAIRPVTQLFFSKLLRKLRSFRRARR